MKIIISSKLKRLLVKGEKKERSQLMTPVPPPKKKEGTYYKRGFAYTPPCSRTTH